MGKTMKLENFYLELILGNPKFSQLLFFDYIKSLVNSTVSKQIKDCLPRFLK